MALLPVNRLKKPKHSVGPDAHNKSSGEGRKG